MLIYIEKICQCWRGSFRSELNGQIIDGCQFAHHLGFQFLDDLLLVVDELFHFQRLYVVVGLVGVQNGQPLLVDLGLDVAVELGRSIVNVILSGSAGAIEPVFHRRDVVDVVARIVDTGSIGVRGGGKIHRQYVLSVVRVIIAFCVKSFYMIQKEYAIDMFHHGCLWGI